MEMYGTTQEDLEAGAAGGRLANQVGFCLVAALGGFLLSRGGRPWRAGGALPTLMLVFLAPAFARPLWSGEPARTVKRAGILTLCFAGALGVGRRLTGRELGGLAVAVTATYAAIGLAAELALRTFGPWDPEYRFAGTLHPNGQGGNCALLCLSAF